MTAKFKFILYSGLLLVASAGRSALAGVFDFMYPREESNHASHTDFTFDLINWITVVSFIGIIVVMVYFAVRYRRKDPHQRAESQVSHSTSLELVWSVPPIIAVAAIFWYGFSGFVELRTPPANCYTINVEAYQFGWQFTHPNGLVETNVLQVPAGEPVKLVMQSRDTIHSLYIPAFRVKQDVLRGRFSMLWFMPLHPTDGADFDVPTGDKLDEFARKELARQVEKELVGNKQKVVESVVNSERDKRFDDLTKEASETAAKQFEEQSKAKPKPEKPLTKDELQAAALLKKKQGLAKDYQYFLAQERGLILFCAELCGEGHSLMMARVVVHTPGWRPPAVEIPTDPVERGAFYFKTKGCIACHDNAAMAAVGYPQMITQGIWGKDEKLKDGRTIKIEGDEGVAYLHKSIMEPAADVVATAPIPMPQQQVTEDEAKYIIEYFKTLKFKGN
ncbi:MAG: c-type cytochrome [Phycisphaera sp.]|nr:c-type cytochrome [Phycisphaera sp.]